MSVSAAPTLADQTERANTTGLTPVVFIHGLWLLPHSWDRWATMFEQAGYAPVQPGWPDDPETVEEANAHTAAFAHTQVGKVAEPCAAVIGQLTAKPAPNGPSLGGRLVQISGGRGLSAATVAIAS